MQINDYRQITAIFLKNAMEIWKYSHDYNQICKMNQISVLNNPLDMLLNK